MVEKGIKMRYRVGQNEIKRSLRKDESNTISDFCELSSKVMNVKSYLITQGNGVHRAKAPVDSCAVGTRRWVRAC